MQAVILAGGEGFRLRPLTYARPKAMIPLANRPIIDYVIDALVANGIRDIMVVAGYRKEQMIRHLNERDLPVATGCCHLTTPQNHRILPVYTSLMNIK